MTTAKKATADAKGADETAKDTVSAADHRAALDRVAELEALLEQATAPVTLVTTEPIAAPPPRLDPPDDLPAGFVFNTITGQQWCGQCAVAPLDPSATSFACDHGSWQAKAQTFTPDEI